MSYYGGKMEDGKIRHFPRCDECEAEKTVIPKMPNWKARCEACKDRGICDENGLTWHSKYANKIKCCNCKNATFTFETLEDLHGKIDGENLAYFCETHGDLKKENLYISHDWGFICKFCQAIRSAQHYEKHK